MVEGGASKQKRSSPRKTRDKNYPFASIKQFQLYSYAAREIFLLHFHSYDNRPKSTVMISWSRMVNFELFTQRVVIQEKKEYFKTLTLFTI